MVVKMNGAVLEDDLYYCGIHDKWNWVGEERNCCAIAVEEAHNKIAGWAAYGVKIGRLTNADKWHFFFQG